MRRVAILSFCFLLPLTASTQAQSSDQVLKDFRTQVLHQRLVLQNFSADAEANFEWTANGLSSTPPKVRTLGVFKLSSANLHNGALLLTGSRSTIYKDTNKKPKLLGDSPVVINIALNGTDPAIVLPRLKQELFFPTLQVAVEAIPPQDRQVLYSTDVLPKPNPPCPAAGASYIRPKAVKSWTLNVSEGEAQGQVGGSEIILNASVAILLTVDETGKTTDLWLTRPSGLADFDEREAKSVSHIIFKPATCDGAPVKTSFVVEASESSSAGIPH